MADQTIQLKQRACPACAAPIPPIPPRATSVQCPYCERAFEVIGRLAPKTPPSGPPASERSAPSSRPEPGIEKKSSNLGQNLKGCAVVTLVFVVLIGLGLSILVPATIGVLATVNPELAALIGPWVGVPPEPPPPAIRPTAGLGFSARAYPVLADADQDGTSDLIAPYSVSREGEGEPAYYLGAFSGVDLSPLWTLGPFSGADREPLGAIVVEDRLVVQEPFGIISIVELRSGRRVGQLQLDKSPGSVNLCRWQPNGTDVLVDGSFLVDAVAGVSRPKKVAMYDLPVQCSHRRGSQNSSSTIRSAAETMGHAIRGTRARRGPRVEGHKTLLALLDGEHGIAVLEAERGRKERVILGFNVSELSERWRAPARTLLSGIEEGDVPPIHLDLGMGAVVWGYTPSGAAPDRLMGRIPPRLLILDAATGRKRHDLELGRGMGGGFKFAFADQRVWFAEDHHGPSRVFGVDLHTGDVLVFGGED
ncbi:MAG: hypothetical protein EA397_17420 [Deltaproteobacteria bacterium]|nr:MAG: hypothetical protein EA397_17420 [Deltaproteobacteria bacterium]